MKRFRGKRFSLPGKNHWPVVCRPVMDMKTQHTTSDVPDVHRRSRAAQRSRSGGRSRGVQLPQRYLTHTKQFPRLSSYSEMKDPLWVPVHVVCLSLSLSRRSTDHLGLRVAVKWTLYRPQQIHIKIPWQGICHFCSVSLVVFVPLWPWKQGGTSQGGCPNQETAINDFIPVIHAHWSNSAPWCSLWFVSIFTWIFLDVNLIWPLTEGPVYLSDNSSCFVNDIFCNISFSFPFLMNHRTSIINSIKSTREWNTLWECSTRPWLLSTPTD